MNNPGSDQQFPLFLYLQSTSSGNVYHRSGKNYGSGAGRCLNRTPIVFLGSLCTGGSFSLLKVSRPSRQLTL